MRAREIKGRGVAVMCAVAVALWVWPLFAGQSSSQAPPTPQQAAPTPAPRSPYDEPRPGQVGHRPHKEWQGAYPRPGAENQFKVVRTMHPPTGFIGNAAYDTAGNRLWLVSLGKPTNPLGSSLYEYDVASGRVVAETKLPLIGDFGDPVYLGGYLYQPVYHESKMYKIEVNDKSQFGKVVAVVPLPTLNDLNLVDESHPFPFIEFGGVGVTGNGQIIFHADDVGEFLTIAPDTGRIVSRVRTLKALGGLDAVQSPNGQLLVLANSDPRGGYCALSFPPSLSRTPDQKDISWAVLDGRSGEVLASIRTQNSRAYAATVALMRYEPAIGDFGKFTFLATGEEGLLVLEWAPTRDAF